MRLVFQVQSVQISSLSLPLTMLQKVNDSGMDDGPPSPLPETSIQEPGTSGRTLRPEAPVDTMLKDMATIIFSTFLLAGWVAFVITYPKVSHTSPPSGTVVCMQLPKDDRKSFTCQI